MAVPLPVPPPLFVVLASSGVSPMAIGRVDSLPRPLMLQVPYPRIELYRNIDTP